MKIITHPDNRGLLESTYRSNRIPIGHPIFYSPYVPKDEPTGQYVITVSTLPWRNMVRFERTVLLDEICIKQGFVTYGPEDLSFLLYSGMVYEHRKPLFYLLNDVNYPELVSRPDPFDSPYFDWKAK